MMLSSSGNYQTCDGNRYKPPKFNIPTTGTSWGLSWGPSISNALTCCLTMSETFLIRMIDEGASWDRSVTFKTVSSKLLKSQGSSHLYATCRICRTWTTKTTRKKMLKCPIVQSASYPSSLMIRSLFFHAKRTTISIKNVAWSGLKSRLSVHCADAISPRRSISKSKRVVISLMMSRERPPTTHKTSKAVAAKQRNRLKCSWGKWSQAWTSSMNECTKMSFRSTMRDKVMKRVACLKSLLLPYSAIR